MLSDTKLDREDAKCDVAHLRLRCRERQVVVHIHCIYVCGLSTFAITPRCAAPARCHKQQGFFFCLVLLYLPMTVRHPCKPVSGRTCCPKLEFLHMLLASPPPRYASPSQEAAAGLGFLTHTLYVILCRYLCMDICAGVSCPPACLCFLSLSTINIALPSPGFLPLSTLTFYGVYIIMFWIYNCSRERSI